MKAVILQFEDSITNQTDKNVKIKVQDWKGDFTNLEDDGGAFATGSKESPPQQHEWVKKMEEFRSALRSLHGFLDTQNLTPPRIKVRSHSYCSWRQDLRIARI